MWGPAAEEPTYYPIVNVPIPPTVPTWPGGFDQAESAISSVPAKVPRQHVADSRDAAVCAADHGESLQCEGGPGAIPQEMFEARLSFGSKQRVLVGVPLD